MSKPVRDIVERIVVSEAGDDIWTVWMGGVVFDQITGVLDDNDVRRDCVAVRYLIEDDVEVHLVHLRQQGQQDSP